MKALTDAQKQAIANGKLYSAYLLDITLQGTGAPTLHISDRTITVSGVTYQNYLKDLSGLGEEIDRANSEGRNADITLVFKNKPYLTYNFFIQIGSTYPFEGALITIKEILINDLNVPGEPITIHMGVLDEAQDVDTLSFTYQASSLWKLKDEQFKQALITAAVYPGADPDDINKPANIGYGSLQQVKCHAVAAGAVDNLTANITASSPGNIGTLVLSDASKYPASGAFTIQTESEQIRIASRSGNTLTLASSGARGYNSTTAAAHDKGMAVFEVKTEYIYLIKNHPVKAIGNVYVDKIRQLTGYTAYTGQSGDELSGYEGKAVIKFTVKPVVQKQVNLGVDVTNPTHGHQFNGASQNQNASTLVSPAYGCSDLGGSLTQNITFVSLATAYQGNSATVGFTVSYNNCGIPDYCEVKIGGITVFKRVNGSTTINLGTSVSLEMAYSGGSKDLIPVYINESSGYNPNPHTQSGIKCQINSASRVAIFNDASSSTAQNTSASLTGNSSADTVIGTSVNADVDCWKDDAFGTYTGTANALIERPDHVFKHFLDVYFGYALTDIDTASFAAAGALYASAISGGYKFAFCINKEIRSAKQEILENLASQCRSTLVEEGGKWYLDYIPDTAPTEDKTIKASELVGEYAKFLFHKTARVDIENDLTAKFGENYGKLSYDESEWQGTATASDSTSQGKYGIKPTNYIFNAIRSQAMADHVLAFKLLQKKNPLWLIDATLFWQHYDLERGDTIAIENTLNNGMNFFLEWVGRSRKGFVEIKGKEWVG
ncbi:MAG: hypothetical protein Q7U10_08830 [Thermodesulfovibrionia bacterium]|nr:hypothetical protein [Thermodesulfovibrionia bacterium]